MFLVHLIVLNVYVTSVYTEETTLERNTSPRVLGEGGECWRVWKPSLRGWVHRLVSLMFDSNVWGAADIDPSSQLVSSSFTNPESLLCPSL